MRAVALAIALGLAILVGTATLSGVAHADKMGFDPAAIYKVPLGDSPTFGPADAPVTIVVFSDHACGFCFRVQQTLSELSEMYPHQLRWVHRTLPLDEDVTLTAEATLAAAAQGAFKPMSDRLYALAGRVDREAVELIGRDLGLDMLRFRADLDAKTYRAQVLADGQDAAKLGVAGTPTFFVNGRPVHGNQPLKLFADVIDQELARAKDTPGGYAALVASGKPVADVPGGTEHPAFELDTHELYRVGLGLPGHQLGPDNAPVTIVEWSDFQCPFCQRNAPVLAAIHEKYGDDVRIVFRYLPMSFHRHASLAAEAAIAASVQGKFWPYHDQLFAQFPAIQRADLEAAAEKVGLDMKKFKAALDDRRYRALVVAESASGLALGVDGTPTMFVNGQAIVGARELSELDTIVTAHLERARAAIKAGVPATDIYAVLMSDAEGVERADPARVPNVSVVNVAPRAHERAQMVEAACREHDAVRAKATAAGLAANLRAAASATCAAAGIDL
ncbi:MAG TPA: thioredoxin domain-containing protein [Kofleriaceae bacterium]|jgi:protein-disulfide isomerase